ncbi:SDR family NAD(P)-dependent oxidoreductase [Nonomuraea monospora]|uniref:SDR family NAD(P)-dependent oxidoreductase n=1 Tax=Nonomuraea monospora TaxID=568818 RepID=A0ABN3D4P9_9ACTN
MTRVAVVTGAADGLGRAIAVRLAERGHDIAIADLRPAEATAAEVRALGAQIYYEECELASSEAIDRFCANVTARFGRCDVLVNNAAHQVLRTLGELDWTTWRRVQTVNVDAAFLLCGAFVPGMAERGFGRVVNIVSNTVWEPPGPGFLAYVTSKAGLLGLTRALAVEVGESGVTVNAVAPGLTRTPGALRGMPPEVFEDVRLRQAVKRTLEPSDVAGAVAFLVSDDASLITGQALRVDGGLVTL